MLHTFGVQVSERESLRTIPRGGASKSGGSSGFFVMLLPEGPVSVP